MKRATALKVLAGTLVLVLLASAFPVAQMMLDAADPDTGQARPPVGQEGGSSSLPTLPFDPDAPGASLPGDGAALPSSPADGLFSPGLGQASRRSTGSALLDQVIGSAMLMGHDVEVPPLPEVPAASSTPLRAAILEWIAVTGSPVGPEELAAELAKADALPLPLQRDLALLVLAASQASLLQAQALARLTPEEVAWVHTHPGIAADLAAGRDTPETRRLAALAALVDTPLSIQASLLLLEAVEATRGSLSGEAAARALADLPSADLHPTTRALLALLATSGGRVSDADKVRLAAELVAVSAGLPVPASAPRVSFREALAALLSATAQPVDPQQLSLVLARADALPADLQAALAGPLLAQAHAVRAANGGDQAQALVGVLVAVADALPTLEKYSLYWREAPDALRVGQWTPTHRAGWVAEHAALLAGAADDPARLVKAGALLHGLGVADARVPERSFPDAFAALAAETGRVVTPAMLAEVDAAATRLDPATRDAAALLMSGAAESARLRREAFAALTPEEERFLRVESLGLDALALKDPPTQDELARLARASGLASRVDGALLAQAGLVGVRATMEARDVLAGRGVYAAASAHVEPVSRWAWLAGLLPFGMARAQADAPCVDDVTGIVETDCANDVLLRIALNLGGGSADCDARTCNHAPEENTELLVITGTRGAYVGPQKVDRLLCDRNDITFTTCVQTTVSAYGAPLVHLDLGGADTYGRPVAMTSVNATTQVSLHLDAGGADTYLDPTSQYDGRSPFLRLVGRDMGHPTQGSALFGGVAVLVDAEGDDTYAAPSRSQGFGRYGVGILVDLGGADRYRAGALAQGVSGDGFNLGLGIHLDAVGDDARAAVSGQGYGLGGVLVDLQGRDTYANERAPRGVPAVRLEAVPGGDLTALDERRDESAWVDGPGDLNLGIGLDQESTLLGSGDRDGDGWSDSQEFVAGSGPDDPSQGVPEGPAARAKLLAADSDLDLYPDFVERALSTDPEDARSYPAGFPRGPTFHEPTGVYGETTPTQDVSNPGLAEGSDKVLDLRLPLQDAGVIEAPCTGAVFLNITDPLPVGFPSQTLTLPPPNPANVEEQEIRTPGVGGTDNQAEALEGEQVANVMGEGWSRGERCVFVSYETRGPGEGNASQPFVGRPEESRTFRFRLPAGILAVGDSIRTRYDVDYFFVVDLGGNDVFNNSAGGALPVETRSNPYSGPSDSRGALLNNTQPSNPNGNYDNAFLAPSLVLNVDPATATDGTLAGRPVTNPGAEPGDDAYEAPADRRDFTQGSLWGVLVDTAGRDRYSAGSGSQGSLGGVLLDLGGADQYRALNLSQGAGMALAPRRDTAGYPLEGADPSRDASIRRVAPGLLLDHGEADKDVFTAGSHSQGFARGFVEESLCTEQRCRGVTPEALGILLSQGGHDRFDTLAQKGVESQGVGTQMGVGILLDTDGDDDYLAASPLSHGATVSQTTPRNGAPLAQPPGAGVLVDLGGTDEYLVGTLARGERQDNLTLTRAPMGFAGERGGVLHGDPGVHLDTRASDPAAAVNAIGGGRPAAGDAASGFLVHLPTARLAIGDAEATRYRGVDYAFVVDLGGANEYEHNAGGLVPALVADARAPLAANVVAGGVADQRRPTVSLYPVSFLLDAGSGASAYRGGRAFSQGAGFFSVGVLVDNGGADRFTVAPEPLPALNNTWMSAPPTVDGAVDASEWAGVPARDLVFASTNDSRLVSPFKVRVANDADNLYVAITGRTASASHDERRADRLVLALDASADHVASAPVPGAKDGARQTFLDGLVLGTGLPGCAADAHWMATDVLPDPVVPRPDVKASCLVTQDGLVSYEVQKPLREAFPKDLGDLNLPYDPVVGWTDVTRLGLHLEFIEKATGIVYAWPPATTVRDGELGFRADANLSDEMGAWAVASLANLGNATPVPVATRSPVFSQGAGLAGVGILAMLGAHGSDAELAASDRAQGYGGFGGLGVLLDAGGSDLYRAASLAQGAAETQGFGLLLDAEGNDRYESSARSLGHADASPSGALFLDLYGYDAYTRRPPTLTVASATSADLASGAPPGNERVWVQGAGAGADYTLTATARKALGQNVASTQLPAERVTLRVTKHVNGACTDQAVDTYPPDSASPKPVVDGLVCLKADVDLGNGNLVTGADPVLAVDGVDFLLDGTRLAGGVLTSGPDPSNPGPRSTWTHVLDGTTLGDGVLKLAALAVYRLEQQGQGTVLFYDDIDPANEAHAAVRSVYVNNAPKVDLRLTPPFAGAAEAAFSPLASAPAQPHLRAEYAVSRDAGEDSLAIDQGWKVPARFSNVPCDDADASRLCHLLPLYFGKDAESWSTTPRGSPAERETHRETSGGVAPFYQTTEILRTPLEVMKRGSFHVALPDHNTTLPRPGEYKTRITLRLIGDDGSVRGVLHDGVFSSRRDPIPVETALNLFKDLRPVSENVSTAVAGASKTLDGNPLELLVATLLGPCQPGYTIPNTALPLNSPLYCEQLYGNPGATANSAGRLCHEQNPLKTLRSVYGSVLCAPGLGPYLDRAVRENENQDVTNASRGAAGLLRDGASALAPPPGSNLNWTDYYFDVDPRGLQDNGDTVVIPSGVKLELRIASETELFEDSGGAATGAYMSVVDQYFAAAATARGAAEDNGVPTTVDLFGQRLDPVGEVGAQLVSLKGFVAGVEKSVSSLTVLPFSFFTYQGGGEEQARMEIRMLAKATTHVEATIETPSGEKVMDLAPPANLQGDVPGTPTRDGNVTLEGGRVRFVPVEGGVRFTQRDATFAGQDPGGADVPDGLYRVRVKATDASDGKSDATSAFLLDRTAPLSRVTTRSFAGAAYVENNALPVIWQAVETGSGLSRVAVYARAGGSPASADWRDVGPGRWQLLGVFPASVTTAAFTLAATDTYHFVSVAEDRVGNVENAVRQADPFTAGFLAKLDQPGGVLTVLVDQTRPSLTLPDLAIEGARVVDYRGADVPFVKAGGPVAFRACAGDERADGVQGVRLVLDQVNLTTNEVRSRGFDAPRVGVCPNGQALHEYAGWGGLNANKTEFPDGIWAASFEAFDRAGNRIQMNLATLVLDSRPPQVALQEPVYPVGQSAVKPGDLLSLRLLATDTFGVDEAGIEVDASALNKTGALRTRPVRVDGILVQEATLRVDVPVDNVVYAVKVRVPDHAGNVQEAELLVPVDGRRFTIDPESVRVTNVTHNSVVLRWNTTENATSQARFGTSPLELRQRSVLVQNLTKEHALKVDGLAPSTRYVLRALSTSAGGYANESDPVEVLTATALFLEPVSPRPGAQLSGQVTLHFKGGLRDSTDAVSYSVEAQPRPDAPWTFLTTLTRAGGEHNVTFNSSRHLDGGAYRLKVTAESGRDRASAVFGPVTLDNTPPTVDVLTPLVATNDTTPEVTVLLRDDLSGLGPAPATLLIDGKPAEGALLVRPGAEGVRVSHVVPSALAPGVHAFELRALDKAGAVAVESWKVSIDGDAPEVTVNPLRFAPGASAAKAGGTVTLNLTVLDASGVSLVTADAAGLSGPAPARLSRVSGTDFFVATIPVVADEDGGARRVVVTAIDLAGNARQASVDVPVDNLAPRVGEVRAGEARHTAIDLRVGAGSEPVVLVGTATAPGSPAVTASTTEPALAPTLAFRGLLPSRTYAYTLQALDGAGNVAEVAGRFATRDDTEAPGVAKDLAITDLLNGTLRLSWDAAPDDVGVAYYQVSRSADGKTFVPVARVEGTEFHDVGLPLEKTFHYQVVAVDHGANEGPASARLAGAATALPRLSVGAASPSVGTPATLFRWTITYASPGGRAPQHVHVLLDGVPQAMVRQEGGDAVSGLTYVYESRLAPHKRDEPHTYSFEASDGRYTVKFPEDGSSLRGPLVSGDVSAADEAGGFAAFAQRVPLGGAAATALALLLAVAVVALVVRRKKEGSK